MIHPMILGVNWLIKPLTMKAIPWLFTRGLFAAWVAAELAIDPSLG